MGGTNGRSSACSASAPRASRDNEAEPMGELDGEEGNCNQTKAVRHYRKHDGHAECLPRALLETAVDRVVAKNEEEHLLVGRAPRPRFKRARPEHGRTDRAAFGPERVER